MKKNSYLVLLVAVIVLILACAPCGLGTGSDFLPGGTVEVSAEAARNLEKKVASAITENPSDQFTLRITDEEITSFATLNLPEKGGGLPITRPQIRLTQGKFFVGGLLSCCPLQVKVLMVGSARAKDNYLEIKVEKALIGPFSLPEQSLNSLSESINKSIREEQPKIQISEVQILEGEIVITGQK
ncbi:MAG: hypothetical protein ACUVV0_15730 [Anaerolineae bacterium]